MRGKRARPVVCPLHDYVEDRPVGQGFPLRCTGLADQEFHIIVAVHRDFLGRVLRSERSQRWAGRCGSRRCRGRWRGTRRPKPHTFTSMPTPRSGNEQSHAPLRSEPSPADIDHPTSFSPSSRASDYVELLIHQTHTPQGKSLTDRPVFHIIVQGTYNRTCDFHRIRLKQAPRAHWQAEVLCPMPSPTCRRWHWAWMRRSLVSSGVPS